MIEQENPNWLIVEGYADLNSVVGVMRKYTPWPESKTNAPVWIQRRGGVHELLDKDYLDVVFGASTLRTLGLIVDANSDCKSRYASIRSALHQFNFNLPRQMPPSELIVDDARGLRIGAWIMPDNRSTGALEDFLIGLVPETGIALLDETDKHIDAVKQKKLAKFRQTHIHKARLYSWLALQDPPTQDPRKALYKSTLDPMHSSAQGFVDWFLKLYKLERLS